MDCSISHQKRLFRSFATLSAFLALKSSKPLEFSKIADTLNQNSSPSLTAENLAVFRGILGTQYLDIFWSTTSDVEQQAAMEDSNKRIKYSKTDESTLFKLSDATKKADAEHRLFFVLNTKDESKATAAKRKRTLQAVAPNPVQVITRLSSMFDAKLDEMAKAAESGEERPLEGVFEQLVRHNLPPKPQPRQNQLRAANDSPLPITELLTIIRDSDFYKGQMVSSATRILPAAEAQYQSIESLAIDAQIWGALKRLRNIDRLYSHQAQSIEAAIEGQDVMVSTATASGKSVIYQASILQMLIDDPTAKALLVFPTKALAQDQLGALEELVRCIPKLDGIKVSTLDGDTLGGKSGERQKIRQSASVILTNPDTLHMVMLPNSSALWRHFWAKLQIVVIDELHVYQGQFGQNVAHIFARLQRMCKWARSEYSLSPKPVQFIACSATTSNPIEHMQHITGKDDICIVDTDGSPHGPMHMVLWDNLAKSSSNGDSSNGDSTKGNGNQRLPGEFSDVARISSILLRSNIRCIIFCKYRQTCELVFHEIADYLRTSPSLRRFIPMVMSYRAGYTKQERRDIERAMFTGSTRMVIATNALELGIDVGNLDAVLMVGVPPNKTNLWQQAGRAGRRGKESLAMVFATGNILDRHIIKKPDDLFKRTFPMASLTSERSIAIAHLQCAAFELPIDTGDGDSRFITHGLHLDEDGADMAWKDHLVWDPVTQKWLSALRYKPWPAEKVPIRSIRQTDWQVIEVRNGGLVLLEEIDSMRALFTLYEGGIFLHRGKTYEIDRVDTESHIGFVRYANVSWYTEKRDFKDVIPQGAKLPAASDNPMVYGELEIRATVFGYKRYDLRSKQLVEVVEKASPIIKTLSLGIWIDVPITLASKVAQKGYDVEASIHGAQHSLLVCLAEATGCMFEDLCTECKSPLAKRTKVPRLVVYEKTAVSNGPTARAVAKSKEILQLARDRISSCQKCEDGCAACVYLASGCAEQNECINKAGALVILQGLLSN
ncbi:ATP-dependent 3'-5' DNA helicase [Dipsacomyces acuminosporus]|nr:ATP-dependent 3'-5' DNA helicase [Dipsacomyces acuminosporus]